MGIAISSQAEEAILNGLALKPQDRTQSITELMEEMYADVVQPVTAENQEPVSCKESESRIEETSALSKQEQVDVILDTITEADRLRYEKEIQSVRRAKTKNGIIETFVVIAFLAGWYCLIPIFSDMNIPTVLSWGIFIGIGILGIILIIGIFLTMEKQMFFSKIFSEKVTSDKLKLQIHYFCKYLILKKELLSITAYDVYGEKRVPLYWLDKEFINNYYKEFIVPAKNVLQKEKDAWVDAVNLQFDNSK